jgi:hypothetical protein
MKYIIKISFLLFVISFLFSCNKENHIEKYNVNIDSLKLYLIIFMDIDVVEFLLKMMNIEFGLN